MGFANYRQLALAFVVTAASCLTGPYSSKPQSLQTNPTSSQTGQIPAPPVGASDQTLTAPVVPQDPKDLLVAAAKANGLDAPGLRPWHILVSYDKFDEDGDNVDSGTYEEYWAGPKQYRLSYSSPDFTQTDVATDRGLYREGADKWPGELQMRVRDEFVRPMFREMDLLYGKPEKKVRDFGNMQLPCVTLRRSDTVTKIVSESGLAAFCFEPDSLMLRYSKGGMAASTVLDQTVYAKILRFQGQYVAKDVQVTRGGKLFLKLQLEKLELIAQLGTADFTPPKDAVAVAEQRVVLDPRPLELDYLLHREWTQYPKSLYARGGRALMKFVIGKDGHVTECRFVEGTPEMKKTLQEAIKKNVYRPFLVRGEPVEVEVTQEYFFKVQGR